MVRKIICILVLLLVIANASAATTKIVVDTYANHDITVHIIKAGGEDVIETLQENSGSTGKLALSFSTGENKVDISTIARKDGKIIASQKVEGQSTGGEINIELIKEEDKAQAVEEVVPQEVEEVASQEVQNETPAEEIVNEKEEAIETAENLEENAEGEKAEELTIQQTKETEGLTGASVLESRFLSKGAYLVIIILFVAGGLAFFLIKMGPLKAHKIPGEIRVRKYSEMKDELENKNTYDEKKLEELEKRMQEIKTEIDSIKESKENKIKEVEARVRKDFEELRKLKGEQEAVQERLQESTQEPQSYAT